MNAFTIKDIENLSGIRAHTIRIWEQRYTFLNPERSDTNIRYYNSEELKTVLNVALLNKYGFKISHISRMSGKEIHEKILSLSQVEAQQERIINTLVQSMVDLDMDLFESIVDNYILARGIEKTIVQLIFPLLEKIGILWVTSHINPAQEHLITNIIRQKLIVGIAGCVSHIHSNKVVLLFLPEGEHHELGLLFTYYLLKSRGSKVLYIGANAPLKDVEYVAKLRKPDFLYTHLTSVTDNFNFDKFINNIKAQVPGIPIIISGKLTQLYKKKVPVNIYFKKSLKEVMEYISDL